MLVWKSRKAAWQTDYLLVVEVSLYKSPLWATERKQNSPQYLPSVVNGTYLMEWNTLSSEVFSVLQQDFDTPPNIILLQISTNTRHNGRDRMLQVCMCSLLMCPKIKNFHSEQVGLVYLIFSIGSFCMKSLWRLYLNLPQNTSSYIFLWRLWSIQ